MYHKWTIAELFSLLCSTTNELAYHSKFARRKDCNYTLIGTGFPILPSNSNWGPMFKQLILLGKSAATKRLKSLPLSSFMKLGHWTKKICEKKCSHILLYCKLGLGVVLWRAHWGSCEQLEQSTVTCILNTFFYAAMKLVWNLNLN